MAGLGLGIILDRIIGDPHGIPHPVVAIGKLISHLEKGLLGSTDKDFKRDAKREKRNGILLWFIVEIIVLTAAFLIMYTSYRISRYLGVIAEAVLTCYVLAARSLKDESMAVYMDLKGGDLSAARRSLSMIVGRDTDYLDEEEVAKAAVETVAENTSDGVVAPLLYAAAGGPVLGLFYKAVNTMDSMLGYRNDRYENFGFFAAKADDVFNFIPARISALFMILAAFLLGAFSPDYSGTGAFKIWKRDRYNHRSPNSAQTESVCAGALGLKLGGTHLYNGVSVTKPTIGDELRKAGTEDIKRANSLMLMTQALTVIFVFAVILMMTK